MFHPGQRLQNDGPVISFGQSQIDPLLDVLWNGREFLGLVEVLPHAIDDPIIKLDSRNDPRVDRLGPHLLLRREGLAEGVGPGPCAERLSRGRVDGVKFKVNIYAASARMRRNFSINPGFFAG